MTREEFISRVGERLGIPEASEVLPIVEAVLHALGERLSRLESEALADELPGGLGAAVRRAQHGQDLTLGELQGRVARREEVSRGFAIEHLIAVCQVVTLAIGVEAASRIQRELPEPIAKLFRPPEEPPPAPVHLHPERHTLAEGRAGSSRPLSEGRADRAHTQSVARSEDPHGDSKLSGARGLTQEREGESLATGHPPKPRWHDK